MSEKILITGGDGFVGRNVINELAKSFPDAHIYNMSKNKHPDKKIKHIQCEASTYDFEKLSKTFDYIIHLLAISHNANCSTLSYAKAVNVDFTYNLLNFASKQKKLKRFIYISSTVLYDKKLTPPVSEESSLSFFENVYNFTKGMAEQHVLFFLKTLHMPITIFRLSNIYGPYQLLPNSPFLIPSKIGQALSTKTITVLDASAKKDWIFATDAAEAIVLALSHNYNGVLNLASGKSLSVGTIMTMLAELTESHFQESKDANLSHSSDFFCDIRAIQKELSWTPKTSMREGLVKTLDHISKSKDIL